MGWLDIQRRRIVLTFLYVQVEFPSIKHLRKTLLVAKSLPFFKSMPKSNAVATLAVWEST